jgi:hypothetical protein
MGRFRLSSQPVPESRNRRVNLICLAEHVKGVIGVDSNRKLNHRLIKAMHLVGAAFPIT